MPDKPKLSIVPDKPAEIDRARCPEHGIVTYAIEAVATPIIGKSGKATRQNGSKRLLCPLCLAQGKIVEVGR